ncbi:MAG: hypothetical protein LBE91_22420, partial [Tannerella sp.]|nr:hypothetical protein [Tannerella sp.]
SVARNDADSVAACEEDYEVWYTETAEVVGKLSMEEIKEFVPYSAKLSLQWYDLRVKYGEE